MPDQKNEPPHRPSAAPSVAAGIFLSRIFGILRARAVLYFFGISAQYDVFATALRMPNFLQNLLGEGTLSAAFIPIYSKMLAEGRAKEAGRFAGAIFGLLLAVVSGLVLLGIVFADQLVTILTPGFVNDAAEVARGELTVNRFDLTVYALRIVFPMAGIFVLSAWALGILNSHRRFFLSYFAPVLWNVSIIVVLFSASAFLVDHPDAFDLELFDTPTNKLLFAAFLGALLGGLLQFLIQIPLVFHLLTGFRFSISQKIEGVREAVHAFFPVVAGRGVAQLSGYLDMVLASLLAAGAPGALRAAFTIYMLPVSLFGGSVAASELPELSAINTGNLKPFLARLDRSLRQILFFTAPTLIGYLCFGFLVVGGLFRSGNFGLNGNWLVYLLVCGYSLGLLATTMSRLLQNTFYALRDTKTPAKIAVIRVIVSTIVAVPLMFFLDRFPLAGTVGIAPQEQPLFLGTLGLCFGASVGAWVELWRLKMVLENRINDFTLPWKGLMRMMGTSVVAGVPAVLVWWLLPVIHIILEAAIVVGLYAGFYLGLARLTHAPELSTWVGRRTGFGRAKDEVRTTNEGNRKDEDRSPNDEV